MRGAEPGRAAPLRRSAGVPLVRGLSLAALDIEAGEVHRRVDDLRLPAPEPGDPARHVLAVGHQRVGIGRGPPVPRLERRPAHRRREPDRKTGAAGAEVGVELIPHVPHGRVHVGQVRDARRDMSALRDAVTGGDDQVEPAEVEEAERGGHQREQRPVAVGDPRHPLQRRGVDRPRLHVRTHAPRHVEQGEDLRVGEEADQLRELKTPGPRCRTAAVWRRVSGYR